MSGGGTVIITRPKRVAAPKKADKKTASAPKKGSGKKA